MSGSSIGSIVGGGIGFLVGGPVGMQIGFALGGIAGGILMPPHMKGPDIGDAQTQTMAAGVVRPVVYGHPAPFAGNVTDGEKVARKIKKDVEQGKGGGPTVEEKHFILTYMIRVCEGCDEGIDYVRIWRNDVVLFDARTSFPPGWEGYSDEVRALQEKFLQETRLYRGDETQMPDPALEAIHGVGNTPYYRGTAYIVREDEDVTDMRGAVARWRFEVTRGGVTSIIDPTATIATSPNIDFYYTLQDAAGLADSAGANGTFVPIGNTTVPGPGGVGYQFTTYQRLQTSASANLNTAGTGYTVMATAQVNYIDPAWDGIRRNIVGCITNTIYGDSHWRLELGGPNQRSPRVTIFNQVGSGYHLESDSEVGLGQVFSMGFRYTKSTGLFELIINGTVDKYSTIPINQSFGSGAPQYVNGLSSGGNWDANGGFWGSVGYIAGWNRAITGGEARNYVLTAGVDAAWIVTMPGSSSVYDISTGELIVNNEYVTVDDTAVTLQFIEEDICARCGIPPGKVDLSALAGITVPGYLIGDQVTGADALRPLMQSFFHDIIEPDGYLIARLRGATPVWTLTDADFVKTDGQEYDLAPHEIEYPAKVSVVVRSPESDYAELPQTSFRYSPDIDSESEMVIPLAIPFPADDAMQIADKIHKVLFSKAEEEIERWLPEKWCPRLVVSEPFYYKTRRYMVTEADYTRGMLHIKAVYDRQSNYSSNSVGSVPTTPSPPTGLLLGPTMIVPMNLPPLRDQDNVPGFYVGIQGLFNGYLGADIYVSTDGQLSWAKVKTIITPSIMGYVSVNEPVGGEPITVRLYSNSDSLDNVTTAQAAMGQNSAALVDAVTGDAEVITFETATQNIDDEWELTDIVRPLNDTVQNAVVAGDRFVMLANVTFIPMSEDFAGTIAIKAVTLGTSIDSAPVVEFDYDPVQYVIIHDGGGA